MGVRPGSAIVVGGGVGGLSAAIALAGQGVGVTLLEAAPRVGGKLREIEVGGTRIDGGPTVFTMRWVFEELFGEAGLGWPDELVLDRADLLARHAWSDGSRLDLFADLQRSAEAVGVFAGAAEARRFLAFAAHARRVYEKLEQPFLTSYRPSFLSMSRKLGLGGLTVRPFSTLWRSLGDRFTDPRLIQLFGRYATYCGSSPFLAPATLMLVAHVELDGVWLVRGGMYRLAETLAGAAERLGAEVRTGTRVARIVSERGRATGVETDAGERLDADAVIVNADSAAVAAGLFGPEAARTVPALKPGDRSLSALAWTLVGETGGFPLARHTVFFGDDYPGEFRQIFRERRLPGAPTVYVCAQDRTDGRAPADGQPERLLLIINAPPTGDEPAFGQEEIDQCIRGSIDCLARCGLVLKADRGAGVLTTPADFHRLFPATGGALYGAANHRAQAAFSRPDVRTALPGLYLAGGSVHPGPGVPMAALSGRLAARAVLNGFASTGR